MIQALIVLATAAVCIGIPLCLFYAIGLSAIETLLMLGAMGAAACIVLPWYLKKQRKQ
jgi:hypothetical protein